MDVFVIWSIFSSFDLYLTGFFLCGAKLSRNENWAVIWENEPFDMHYENTPIQIYWIFHHKKKKKKKKKEKKKKMKISDKNSDIFISLLKT